MKTISLILVMISFLNPFLAKADSNALVSLGERLFNETRFSRYFWQHSLNDINKELGHGEEHLNELVVLQTSVPSPFKGQTTSCASCHLVDQANFEGGPGMRIYNDFSTVTKIPAAADGKTNTPRNTPGLVGIGSEYARNRFSHYDAEFADHAGTVLGNMTGRNMGWSPDEVVYAKNHLVRIIKEDDGTLELSQEFGGSYAKVLLSTDPQLEEDFRLDQKERLDVAKASDQQILDHVIRAVVAYMNSLDFEKDELGRYAGSAFDKFLLLNGFSTIPNENETVKDYNLRLKDFLKNLKTPQFLEPIFFEAHGKSFGFKESELEGAKIFFDLPNRLNQKGRCFECHQAPLYSDQSFHNVGATQSVYDAVHQRGAFSQLKIPKTISQRSDKFFQARPEKENPEKVDLGVWNFYERNTELTEFIKAEICLNEKITCTPDDLSPMIARFKTPTLRNLGFSAPYLHHGEKNHLREVLMHYMDAAFFARNNELRNPAPELKEIMINGRGMGVLEAFLNSLNENYE